MFFIGDTQAHSFLPDTTNDNWNHAKAVGGLIQRALSKILDIFPPEDIFYGVGNNDAYHNSAFIETDDQEIINCTREWATPLIENEIVTNAINITFDGLSPVDFYLQTGFYMKQIDAKNKYGLKDSNIFLISTNTNLGQSNKRQSDALEDALDYVDDLDGKVYFCHHPDIVDDGKMIPKHHRDIIIAMFQVTYTNR
eukprot:UN34349